MSLSLYLYVSLHPLYLYVSLHPYMHPSVGPLQLCIYMCLCACIHLSLCLLASSPCASYSCQRPKDRLGDFKMDEDDFVDWLQTGVFRMDLEAGTLKHQPSGIQIDIPSSLESLSPNWTIEQNYSTRNAKLKHLDNGALFPLLGLFREQGHILKGRVKPTFISQAPREPGAPEQQTPVRMGSGSPGTGGRTPVAQKAAEAPTAGAATPTTGPSARAALKQSPHENMQLRQGSDGRYRLQPVPDSPVPGVTPKSLARPKQEGRRNSAERRGTSQRPAQEDRAIRRLDFDESRLEEQRRHTAAESRRMPSDFQAGPEGDEGVEDEDESEMRHSASGQVWSNEHPEARDWQEEEEDSRAGDVLEAPWSDKEEGSYHNVSGGESEMSQSPPIQSSGSRRRGHSEGIRGLSRHTTMHLPVQLRSVVVSFVGTAAVAPFRFFLDKLCMQVVFTLLDKEQ